MEEQFVLRVPPSVAERIDRLLNETASSSHDQSLNLSFSEDGRNGTFVIGDDQFPASLLDLPSILESYKTYDDNVLIKTADIGQMIMIREDGDPAPDGMEYRHGVTPPMRDARRRRFRREPDLNPELVQRVEKDLLNIMNGGTAENLDILPFISILFHNMLRNCLSRMYSLTRGLFVSHMDMTEQDEVGEGSAHNTMKKAVVTPATKPDVSEAGTNAGEHERSDSDESDYSI